jgi:hypothetical protein
MAADGVAVGGGAALTPPGDAPGATSPALLPEASRAPPAALEGWTEAGALAAPGVARGAFCESGWRTAGEEALAPVPGPALRGGVSAAPAELAPAASPGVREVTWAEAAKLVEEDEGDEPETALGSAPAAALLAPAAGPLAPAPAPLAALACAIVDVARTDADARGDEPVRGDEPAADGRGTAGAEPAVATIAEPAVAAVVEPAADVEAFSPARPLPRVGDLASSVRSR